ncbi:sigma factor-like helix-turn-helix DNA-binding protein [Streptomyces sp. NPDC096310]|uniref:sigma factor-like helix-turn-helix DNA-binding protein n=1 Tax=Streptomyces sp. NPDC096310 TaxID=3366082 RepID=UPI0038270592
MRERRATTDRRRAREFEVYAAGAAGRLLHTAALLTAEPPTATPQAQRLLVAALARTYAEWDSLHDADPYDHTRRELALRFADEAWRVRWAGLRAARTTGSVPEGGPLRGLGARERLVLVLRLYEGLTEEQTASLLGLPEDRARALCARAMATLRRTTAHGPSSDGLPSGEAGP